MSEPEVASAGAKLPKTQFWVLFAHCCKKERSGFSQCKKRATTGGNVPDDLRGRREFLRLNCKNAFKPVVKVQKMQNSALFPR